MRLFVPLAAAAILFTSACANDVTGPSGSVAGTWSLRTLNSTALPYTFSPNTTIVSEQLTLSSDGSYNDVASYSDGSVFREFGFYTLNNNAITFNDQTDNITYQGSISGNVLTEISGQYTSVYQKN